MSDSVTYAVSEGVATITLNRPDAMNALDTPTKVLLRDTVLAAAEDPAVRVVVLTGTGRAFCVGQDLKEHIGLLQANDQAALWSTVPDHFAPIALALAEMPKPVIAAINGVAAGAGASMAFACDFRVVADTAGFNLAFTGIALSCDTGISWTLPRLIGHAKALELLYFPRTVPAAESLDLGLATSVVPAATWSPRSAELADKARGRPHGRVRRRPPVPRLLREPHARRGPRLRGRQNATHRLHRRPPQRGGLLRSQTKTHLHRPLTHTAARGSPPVISGVNPRDGGLAPGMPGHNPPAQGLTPEMGLSGRLTQALVIVYVSDYNLTCEETAACPDRCHAGRESRRTWVHCRADRRAGGHQARLRAVGDAR